VVENFAGVSGRLEVVNENPLIIVDFAHSPDGMQKVFESFMDYDIIVVFGAGGNRDKSKRALMGKIANENAKYIYITSDNPRFEDPDLICEDILKGVKDKQKCEVDINRKKSITKAIEKSKQYKNPIILILGKGDESYQIIYDKKMPFDDKKVVKDILNSINLDKL
jgi:UDP-N-acetylmuramoyl-L-alanyl-D-glutamate--2,6-diaminopimelate ligase